MPLSEEQIVRYSRQILLKDVGGVGQEKLLQSGVRLRGEGGALQTAAAYVGAGGVGVELAQRAAAPGEEGFTARSGGTITFSDLNPDCVHPRSASGVLAELPAKFDGPAPWVCIGSHAGEGAILWRGEQGCADCFHATVAKLDARKARLSVSLGALAALCLERSILGLATDLGGQRVSDSGAIGPLELTRCEVHSR